MGVDHRAGLRRDLWLAAALIVAGLLVSLVAFTQLGPDITHLAQVAPAQSPQPSPSSQPAESKPGGTRPTTPAPEPARPDPEAQKTGADPALPPAPAEKVAPPIRDK